MLNIAICIVDIAIVMVRILKCYVHHNDRYGGHNDH